MDLSGMGESDHRTSYDNQLWREEIAAVARDLDNRPVSVVAHSFGGSRALEACAANPRIFRHLTLVDSYVHFEDHPRPKRYQAHGTQRLYADLASAMDRYRLMPPQPAPTYVKEYLARYSLRSMADGSWSWKFDDINLSAPRGEPDSGEMLSNLQVPLALVHGEFSRIATGARMKRIADLVPRCTALVEVPQAHHHVMLDQPLALVACLKAILSGAAWLQSTTSNEADGALTQ
jgi:pimeloyl-ACP methyl ester carboxylesterase